MCKALEDLKLEGLEEGENRMAKLVQFLIAANRIADLTRASEDIAYRNKLFLELGL